MTDRIDVLHVDDDPAVLDLTAAFLDRELDGVDVTGLTEPEAALDRLDAERFDCVVSDYDMPGTNGLEFFEAVRADHPRIPFVLYTGKGSEEIASQALNAGVTGYFQKGGPEQQRRLANRVEGAVREHRTRAIAERYSTVMEALGYPIYVVDETGTFEFVNEAFAELTGYDREEIRGSKPGLIKDDAAVAEAEDRLGRVLSSDGPDVQRFPVDIYPKEGSRSRAGTTWRCCRTRARSSRGASAFCGTSPRNNDAARSWRPNGVRSTRPRWGSRSPTRTARTTR